MTSNKSVIVLTPNGRRQTVKVTPNTTLLQVLEEVCTKHGLKADEYELKHHNTVLDTTTIIRFSGLPNNAQLELKPATKSRLESDVMLGVHLENGSRLMGNFSPSETIINVLIKLCPNEADLNTNPVIIYMRKEIFGELLQTTTLRSLGITSGRAMLRLLHRSPEELHVQANISKPIPAKPVEEKPYIRTFKAIDQSDKKPEVVHENKPEIKSDEKKREQPSWLVDAKKNDLLEMVQQEKRRHKDSSPPRAPLNKPETMEVDKNEYEAMDVVKDDVNLSLQKTIEEEFVFLGERNAMIFSLETANQVQTEDLPDDFFELTIDDAKKILRDIKQRRYELENGQLITSTMRQLEESKKQLRQINRYKQSIIRVQFPDRTVLQGIFTPVETVQAVSDFVKDYLDNKNVEFYLYTTPPKTILDKNSRLLEIGCVPGALLHFGSSNNAMKSFLRKDLIGKFTSNSVASLAAMKMRKQATRSISTPAAIFDPTLNDDDINVGASTSKDVTYEDYPSKSAPKSTEKMPKWFKPSK